MQMYVHTASPARPRLRSFPATAAAFRAAGTVFTGAQGCWGSGQVGQDTRVKVLNLYLERKKLTQGLCDGEITSWTVSTGEVKTGGQDMWEIIKNANFVKSKPSVSSSL